MTFFKNILVVYGCLWYNSIMAYIKTTTNKQGRTHVYLVEGYRVDGHVRHRIIHRYGLLEDLVKDEPDILERLKKEAKEGNLTPQKTIEVSFDLDSPISEPDKSYGWKILDEIYQELDINTLIKSSCVSKNSKKLNEVLKLLVFQRILNPCSKMATVKSQKQMFGNWNITQNDIYRSLDPLNELKEKIQKQIHEQITRLTDRVCTLVFYDVTNYYFETDIDDDDILDQEQQVINEGLRRRGASKENRPNPIVQLGLFMDLNGIPIAYKLFRGNQTDPVTYLPAVEQIKQSFEIKKMVVVADKAMNSQSNLKGITEKGDSYLFSQKHRGRKGAPKDIQEQILDPQNWHFNENLSFAIKSYIRKRKIGKGKQATTINEKVVITWNQKYAIREKIRRDGAIEYAQKLTNAQLYHQTSKKGGKKYLELNYVDPKTGEVLPYTPIIKIDNSQIEFDEQFDGVNVLVTSEIDMTDEQIINAYKGLSNIEDCFRVTKTDLQSRPVYVWKKEHIESHFLSCYIGLVILRYLQYKSNYKLSSHKIIKALNSAKASKLKDDYYKLQENEEMKKLNEVLGIKWEKGIVKYEELKNYAKGFVYNKK